MFWNDFLMVWNVFYFRWGTLETFQNALRMFLNAFQRFQMRCAEKRLNAIFIKPGFPKEGHIWKIPLLEKMLLVDKKAYGIH